MQYPAQGTIVSVTQHQVLGSITLCILYSGILKQKEAQSTSGTLEHSCMLILHNGIYCTSYSTPGWTSISFLHKIINILYQFFSTMIGNQMYPWHGMIVPSTKYPVGKIGIYVLYKRRYCVMYHVTSCMVAGKLPVCCTRRGCASYSAKH